MQVNLFRPLKRLIAKSRTGAIVRKRHDTATTPLRRLLDRDPEHVDPHDRQQLEAQLETTDLLALRYQIVTDIQANVIELARRRGTLRPRAETNAVYLSRRKTTPPQRGHNEMSQRPATRGHLDTGQ